MGNLISWDNLLDGAMSMPLVKIKREDYLREVFSSYGSMHAIDVKRPIDIFTPEIIDNVAKSTIKSHLIKVTGTSAAAGIPGGFAMFASVPADIAQFYWHAIVLSQKLAYIYGYPNLLDEKNNVNEETRNKITLFIGVMLGAGAATKALSEISKQASIQVAKRLPQKALTKTSYYPIIKSVGKWIGLNVTKSSFSKGVSKVIPILGGVVSGGMTYASFKPMAEKLQRHLKDDMELHNLNMHHFADVDGFQEFENIDDDFIVDEEKADNSTNEVNFEFIKIQTCINIAKIDFNLDSSEIEFITELIENSDLSENDQMILLNQLHDKEIYPSDFSTIKSNDLYAITLIESIVQIVKIDGIVKSAEKIYLFKIANELGFSREDVKEMLDS